MNHLPSPILYPVDHNDQLISIHDVLQILRRHLLTIAAVTLIAAFLTALYTQQLTPVFIASTSLELKQGDRPSDAIESLYSIGGDTVYLKTQYQIMQSRTVMERVVNRLQLTTLPEFNWTLKPVKKPIVNWRTWLGIQQEEEVYQPTEHELHDDAIGILQGMTKVSPVSETNIAIISVESANQSLTPILANAIADAYINVWLDEQLSTTSTTTQWLEGRLSDLSNSLDQTEKKLQAYREQENLINLDSELELTKSQLKSLTTALAGVEQKLAQKQSIYQEIQSSGANTYAQYSRLPGVMADTLLRSLKEQEATAEKKVDELRKRYGPKHPDMISARSELNSIQRTIRQQTIKIVSGIEKQYEVLLDNERNLSETLNNTRRKIQAISRKQYQLSELEREVKTREQLHDAFFTRINENTASSDFRKTNARVLDPAHEPRLPAKPKKKLFIILAGIAGLLLSTGAIFLLELLNNTVRTRKDIEEKLKLPFLGSLPNIKPAILKKKKQSPLHGFGNHHYLENIRTIRTQLQLQKLPENTIVSIVSSTAREGRTSTLINLASAFGQMGKTLIIDSNFQQHHSFLTTLAGSSYGTQDTLDYALREQKLIIPLPTSLPNVDIIPSGESTDDAQNLLSSPHFDLLLKELRKGYDYLLTNCPPLLQYSDAQLVIRHSDCVLYIIDAGNQKVPDLITGALHILKTGKDITGVILNKAKI